MKNNSAGAAQRRAKLGIRSHDNSGGRTVRRNIITVPVRRVDDSGASVEQDLLAVEEPLEIQVDGRTVAVTMRTPGDDRELAAGFLLSEGILQAPAQIAQIGEAPP